jgi:hypothetical protein
LLASTVEDDQEFKLLSLSNLASLLCNCVVEGTNPQFSVQVTTADRIETIKFGVDESSNKVPRFEGGGFHEEPSTTYVETRTHDSSVRELIMAPSISKWGKEGSACAWSDNEDLEAAELLTKMPDVISKFEGFHFPISQIVKEDRLESFPQCTAHADVGVEVAYEGGDEDGDSAGEPYTSMIFFS